MTGINLRVATLKNAKLKNCNLRGATLAGTDLEVCSAGPSRRLSSRTLTVTQLVVTHTYRDCLRQKGGDGADLRRMFDRLSV